MLSSTHKKVNDESNRVAHANLLLSFYIYIYIYIYKYKFKYVWLNDIDIYCLYNFIKILFDFRISVLISGLNW